LDSGAFIIIVRKNKKGFTLIELLVVIAIIALMLSVLMPALNEVKERGKRVVCMSNLRQLSLANVMYAESYGRFVPVEGDPDLLESGAWDVPLPDGEVFRPDYPSWCLNQAYIKFLDQTGIENVGYNLGTSSTYIGLPQKYRCPSYPSKKASVASAPGVVLQTSYGLNVTDWHLAVEDYGDGKLMFIDAVNPDVTYVWDQANYVNHWDEHGEFFGWEEYALGGGDHGPEPMYRHSGGANILFADGHAEYRKKTEIFYFNDGNQPNAAATNVDVGRNDSLWSYFK
jgi:prepilin-type N-terminal cleavage/methylation domain-containing protein/prepilin-type processing-associated H-X9-DG protein